MSLTLSGLSVLVLELEEESDVCELVLGKGWGGGNITTVLCFPSDIFSTGAFSRGSHTYI